MQSTTALQRRPIGTGLGCRPQRGCVRRALVPRASAEPGPGPSEAPQGQPVRPAAAVRPAQRPGPPRGPPGVMLGPDGQPLEVVPIERASEEAWAGVAAVDRGESPDGGWGRAALLAGGDAAVLIAFAAAGRANHGEAMDALAVLGTAAPFLLGWFAAAPLLGGFGPEARGGSAGPAAAAAAKCWAAGVPLGIVFRGLSKGYMPPTPFIVVTLAATAVLMVGWRTALAAATPEAKPLSKAEQAKQRTNKKGNPFEFLSLLQSLTTRW